MSYRAMIFAAGLGTRLRPFTEQHPKALFTINGKTLLAYQIERLKRAGVVDIVVNVHHYAEQIVDYLKSHDDFGIHIAISDETGKLLDTGGGLRHAQWFFTSEPFIACNVDILSDISITDLLQAHRRGDLATVVVSDRMTKRYLLFDEDGCMRGWTNIGTGEVRPESAEGTSDSLRRLAFSGMQVLSGDIFACMEDFGDCFSLIDLYVGNCTKHNIRAYIPENYHVMDIGKTEVLAQAEEFAKSLGL